MLPWWHTCGYGLSEHLWCFFLSGVPQADFGLPVDPHWNLQDWHIYRVQPAGYKYFSQCGTLIWLLQYSLTSFLSAAPDHRFYQKWAPLTDPADTRSGIKGYVKASLNVLMKGDTLSMPSLPPSSSSGATEDIEKSVLIQSIIIITNNIKNRRCKENLSFLVWYFYYYAAICFCLKQAVLVPFTLNLPLYIALLLPLIRNGLNSKLGFCIQRKWLYWLHSAAFSGIMSSQDKEPTSHLALFYHNSMLKWKMWQWGPQVILCLSNSEQCCRRSSDFFEF